LKNNIFVILKIDKLIISVYFFIIFFGNIYAQDMDNKSKIKSNQEVVPQDLKTIIKNDQTDKYKYINGKFVCHNFASTFYLQNSCLISSFDNIDINGIKEDWGIIIQRLNESLKMPIYYVSMVNTKTGFYHAINALRVNPDKPNEISSYIFIEPQTDEVFMTAQELHQSYNFYYGGEPVEISIQTFDEFKKSGPIYQSITNEVAHFVISP